jgi:GAF domain-containing protein
VSDDNRWRAYYRALYQVAAALGESQMEPEMVLKQLLRGVIDAVHLKAASIRLLSKEGLLEPAAGEGLSQQYLEKGPVDLEHSGVDREALRGHPVVIEDVSVDPRFEYPAEAKREGIVSALFVPLVARGEPVGVLRAYTGKKRAFTPDEIELLLALASIGALAIVNARLHQVCILDQQMTNEALWSFHLPDDLLGK